jgi:hypothetical protein
MARAGQRVFHRAQLYDAGTCVVTATSCYVQSRCSYFSATKESAQDCRGAPRCRGRRRRRKPIAITVVAVTVQVSGARATEANFLPSLASCI